jgi:hypothetical protein
MKCPICLDRLVVAWIVAAATAAGPVAQVEPIHYSQRSAAPRPFTPAYFLGRPSRMYVDRFRKRSRARSERAVAA